MNIINIHRYLKNAPNTVVDYCTSLMHQNNMSGSYYKVSHLVDHFKLMARYIMLYK